MTRRIATIAIAAAAIIAAGATALYLLEPERPAMTAATLPATRPALGSLHLRGFGITEDSLALAMQAAAAAVGKSADYDTLYCLSGGAFAPAVDTGDDCRSWWPVKARLASARVPRLARAAGVSANVLASPAAGQDDIAFYHAAAPLVRDALRDGAIILAEGGWDEVGAWDWAGIVTSVGDDDTLRGASLSAQTLEGKTNVPLRYARTLWRLIPATDAAASGQDLNAEILAVAVRRIRGESESQSSGTSLYGLEAMDRWIGDMKTVRGFCQPCFSREPVTGVQDAPDNDRRMYQAALVASRQLNEIAAAAPADRRLWIEQAATCYDHIAQLLAPAVQGSFSYDSLSSLDAQRQYVRDVLEPIKAELTWAAVHLERALILADGGKLLPGAIAAYDPIARTYADMNPIRSDLLMRQVIVKSAGIDDVDYDDLVMLAGFGTTFAYHPGRYYYAYQTPDNPDVTEQRLIEGAGASFERPPKPASAEEAWNLVKQVIDSGQPLQAAWLDDFVIAGYVDSPDPQRRQIYAMGKWSLAQRLNWAEWTQWHERFGRLAYLSPLPTPRRDLTRVILERAVDLGANDNRHLVDFMKEGKFSFTGMEAYAADIADPSKPATDFDGAWLACHAINRQWASRICASHWLSRIAPAAPPAAGERLQHAANLYARSYDLWCQYRMTLGGDDSAARWQNPKARKLGAELLRQAIDVEKQALADMAAALPLLSPTTAEAQP